MGRRFGESQRSVAREDTTCFNAGMLNIQIIGAGLAGLAVHAELRRRGFAPRGCEREAGPGGKQRFGAHRVYSQSATELLSLAVPGVAWTVVEEAPVQLKKGQLKPIDEDISRFSRGEQSLLGRPFFEPNMAYTEAVDRLSLTSGEAFSFRDAVASIDLEKRVLVSASGDSRPFDYLLWTGSLASLMKAAGHAPLPLSKKAAIANQSGSVTWDLVTTMPLLQTQNSLVFNFRYKDLKLRAVGTPGKSTNSAEHLCHWAVFLEDSLLEDHEELAKVCRAFKRELAKQFESLASSTIREKFAFHTEWGPPAIRSIRSLEVFDRVACLGNDCQSEALSPGGDPLLSGLDRELLNCQDFLDHLLPVWVEKDGAKLGPNLVAEARSTEPELTNC